MTDAIPLSALLVPVDGSPLSERALPTAIDLARRSGARLHVLNALDFTSIPPQAPAEDFTAFMTWFRSASREEADAYVAGLVERACAAGVDAQGSVQEGDARYVIMDQANALSVDLIVMSTHGHGFLDRAWLGSVADAVVRESGVPVLLVREENGGTDPQPFRHVLVLLDGSELAEHALGPALELARLDRARITLLQVVHPWVRAMRPMADAPRMADLRNAALQRRKAEAERYLAGVASSVEGAPELIATEVVMAEESDVAEILKFASTHDADLIALATHGRGGVKRLVLGSVADKLIRGSDLPVLALRP